MIIIADVSELTRKIKLPTDRVLSVNGDYQVDGIAFKLPATYEGDFDFTTAAARVHWTGVDKVEHTNLLTDKDTSGRPLWIMPSELTQGGHGVIEFAISFVATDETAAVTKRWISDPVSFRNRRTINGSNEDEEAEEETTYDRLASAIADVRAAQASVDNVAEVLSSLGTLTFHFVDAKADMTDQTKLYVLTTDGYLYYYSTAASDFVPAFEVGGSQEVIDARTDENGTTYANLKTRINTGFTQLKEDLSKIETNQIVGMTPTGKTLESENLFPESSFVASGKYVGRIDNGKAVLLVNTKYDTYIIPVDGKSIYTFTNCRTAAVVTDLSYTTAGDLLVNVARIDSTGGKYILFSFDPSAYPIDSYNVAKLIAEYSIPKNWNLNRVTKTGYQRKIGSIESGGSLALDGKTAIKYGYQIIFKAFISAFSEIKLAFYNYNNSAIANAINITTSDLIIYVGSNIAQTLQHGLSITNDFSLVLDYQSDGVKVTLYSNGSSFTTTTTFDRLTSTLVSPTVISTGTVCESAMLEITVPRAKKSIWYFGDSYITFTSSARWTHYFVENGFDANTLLNGYGGATSGITVLALTALLQYGTPKYAVFATGINDGSDSASAPPDSWVNARDSFISLCESNGIEPIFATVPTVPSINNEQKNAWVRASGYKYIDFAKAVGADGTGAWYSGMLSGDNVHPNDRGAKALYTQAIIDFPEFLA